MGERSLDLVGLASGVSDQEVLKILSQLHSIGQVCCQRESVHANESVCVCECELTTRLRTCGPYCSSCAALLAHSMAETCLVKATPTCLRPARDDLVILLTCV